MPKQVKRIKTLNDLKRQKYYLQRQIKIRGKILDLRIRRFEQKLTVPNITREVFRGSKLEWAMPIAATYLSTKFKSGKDLLGILGGFFAGFGSIFGLLKRKNKAKSQKTPAKQKNSSYNEEQMFI